MTDDDPIRFVLVSGFLGAGKTTLMKRAGERLAGEVGMITNDQASGLVDTSIVEGTAGAVEEIPGGCFCCNFGDLLSAARAIDETDVDTLVCEPVGSCTDLVATVVNPLRATYAGEFTVAPVTVVLDPARVRAYLDDDEARLPDPVRYIFRLQIEEADVVVLNKTDTLSDTEQERLVDALSDRVGDRPVVPVAARETTGIDRWLSVLREHGTAEQPALPEIDYDRYAEGEAALGWVNARVDVDGSVDGDRLLRDVMSDAQPALRNAGVEVAHLKLSVPGPETAHANLTGTGREPRYTGSVGRLADPQLIVNARAVGDPDEIRRLVLDAVDHAAGDHTVDEVQAFRPEYPEPVHRMDGTAAD